MLFQEFPKIGRLSRECVITEKIDGTNASVIIANPVITDVDKSVVIAERDGLVMCAGSRTRHITPAADNYGFARWVEQHADELWVLGEGHHFGEWWGSGIQCGYGLPKGEKRFSLFNVARWGDVRDEIKFPAPRPSICHVVPVLARGLFTTDLVEQALTSLREHGSVAAPGFPTPEGIVIYHTSNGVLFKKTLVKDEEPKNRRS